MYSCSCCFLCFLLHFKSDSVTLQIIFSISHHFSHCVSLFQRKTEQKLVITPSCPFHHSTCRALLTLCLAFSFSFISLQFVVFEARCNISVASLHQCHKMHKPHDEIMNTAVMNITASRFSLN